MKYFLTFCALVASAFATNHYVRQGASGTGAGTSWANACPDFASSCAPGSLVRGDTYYVATGSYCASGCSFNAAVSGTTMIFIVAATEAVNGQDAGWNVAYMGQAVFNDPTRVTTNYWAFNGMYRASNPTNGSGYGFAFNNKSGSTTNYLAADGMIIAASNVTFQYVLHLGSGYRGNITPAGGCEFDVWFQGGSNNYWGYSMVDQGVSNFLFDAQITAVVEHSVFQRNWSFNNGVNQCHGEGIAFRATGGGANAPQHVIFRYNIFENNCGTAMFATPNSDSSTYEDINLYGNLFFYNTGDNDMGCQALGVGDGVIDFFGNATFDHINIYNNVIANVANGPGQINCGAGFTAVCSNWNVQNNVWLNAGSTGVQVPSPATAPGLNQTNNTFTSTNPFVNVSATTAGADDFHLSTDTAAWASVSSSLPTGCTSGVNCFNIDPDGLTRSSSQGAYQYIAQIVDCTGASSAVANLDTQKWQVINRGPDFSNPEVQGYPGGANIAVTNGTLQITGTHVSATCHDENMNGTTRNGPTTFSYSSGMIQARSWNFTNGTIEISAKMPSFSGAWPGFLWLLGALCQASNPHSADNIGTCNWDAEGSQEFDFSEMQNSTTILSNNIFDGSSCQHQVTLGFNPTTAFHRYTLNWPSSGSVTFQTDGTTNTTCSTPIPTTPVFPIINLAANGGTTGSGMPGSGSIDYVVYKDANGSALNSSGQEYFYDGFSQASSLQPACTPGSGTYSSAQTVTCTNPNAGTTVQCYTTNGSTPITNGLGTACTTGTLLASGGMITVITTETLEIVAGTSTQSDSGPATYSYVFTGGAPASFFSRNSPPEMEHAH